MAALNLRRAARAAPGTSKTRSLRRVDLSSAPGLQLAAGPRLGAGVALPLAPTAEQAGAPAASAIATIAAPPRLTAERDTAPPGVDLTLKAAPLATSSGSPGVAATAALLAGPGVAAGVAPATTAAAAVVKPPLAAATGAPGAAASALIALIPGLMLGAASPLAFADGTIWDDGTLWIDS